MLPWPRSLVVMALVLGACSDPIPEVTATSEPETSTTAASTTMAASTTVGVVTSEATTDAPPSDTTMGTVETTTSSTSGESSSSGPDSGCGDDCGSNEVCLGGLCFDACAGAWGTGRYGHCLTEYGDFDPEAICGEGHLCFAWGEPVEQTACSLEGCVEACDCPLPPSGDATVVCGEIIAKVGSNNCYLSCANGETCPDGMTCNADDVCVTDVQPLPVYGDCGNLAPGCAAPGFCVDVVGGEAVCTMPCITALDCPAAFPPGGSAIPTCTDITADSVGFECYLSCIGALSCPDGMTCINGTLCMWPD